jgi:hypothetical protein
MESAAADLAKHVLYAFTVILAVGTAFGLLEE